MFTNFPVTHDGMHPLEHDAFDRKIRNVSYMLENKLQFLFPRAAAAVRHAYTGVRLKPARSEQGRRARAV